MKASTANSSGHFEKRRRPVKSSKRSQVSKRQDNTNADDSLQWQSMQNDWRRCESMYLSWSGGQGPFVINATSYPDNDVDGITSGALEWEIANLVGNHNYFWTAQSPANTTFYFDLEDTSNGQRVTSLLQIHVNGGLAEGVTSCPVDYSNAVNVTSSSSSSSAPGSSTIASTHVATSSTSSTFRTGGDDTSSSSQPTISQKTVKALYAILALLVMALLAMILMQYRLRRRLARLQKGQSTVGRWMNHQDFHSHYDRMHNRKANETDKSGNSMRTMSSSSNLYSTRASESNGQPGQKSVFTHNRSSSASTSISRTSSASTTRRRPISLSSNPFADSGALELDEDDIIHRSASQAKRYSQAESAISDSNTIMTSDTSTSGRLSSVAPSDQVSSVGNASVVSDDHYHRAKAFTIARGPGSSAPKELGTGQFLNPRAAFLESRR